MIKLKNPLRYYRSILRKRRNFLKRMCEELKRRGTDYAGTPIHLEYLANKVAVGIMRREIKLQEELSKGVANGTAV